VLIVPSCLNALIGTLECQWRAVGTSRADTTLLYRFQLVQQKRLRLNDMAPPVVTSLYGISQCYQVMPDTQDDAVIVRIARCNSACPRAWTHPRRCRRG
jgi:hypothetical protein